MSAMRVDAKVVMLGKESVGKTSLVERYVHHRFLVGPYQNTIGAAFVAKPIQVGEKVITLGIWVSQMYSLEPLHIFSRSPQDLQFSLTFSSTRPRKPRPFTQNEKYLYLKIIFFIFIYFFTIVQGKCGLEIWSQSHTNILTLNVESNLNNE